MQIRRPQSAASADDPVMVELFAVEVREVGGSEKSAPLLWRLVTTLPATTLEEALEIVRLYKMRWRIEEVFRVLKSDGLKLEESQMACAQKLFKLAAMGLGAAVRIIQLRDARDGSKRPMTDVIDADQIEACAQISQSLEGKTVRQKKPHAKGSLAWLSWITARLGGRNCYYKPPGPKTMARGWQQLATMLKGFQLATTGKL